MKFWRQNGFTLIELMVTVAIVGIIAAIAVPTYRTWKSGYAVREGVSLIQRDLNRVKMRALETRRECRVAFTTNGYRIEDGNQVMNTPAGYAPAGGWTIFRTKNLPAARQLTLTDGAGNAIVAGSEPTVTFSPRGRAVTMDTVRVNHPDQPGADIVVNIVGRVDVRWL